MANFSGDMANDIPEIFSPAPDAAKIAKDIIPKWHDHLKAAEIDFLFTPKEIRSKGRIVMAKTQKCSGLLEHYSKANFVITISFMQWIDLSEKQKIALIDHELCHCGLDVKENGEASWVIIGHDVEEFNVVIERHGLWSKDVGEMAETIKQLKLFPDAGGKSTNRRGKAKAKV